MSDTEKQTTGDLLAKTNRVIRIEADMFNDDHHEPQP